MPLQSTLCYDVWVNVLALLEHRADVLAVMSTCHDLNYAGAKYALAFRVVIGSMGRLISFCEFLLRDINNRGPFLHELMLTFKLDNLDPYSSGEEDDDDVYSSGEEEDDSSVSMRDEEEALHGIALLSQVFRGSPNLKCLDIQCFELLMERRQDLVEAFTQLRSLVYLRTNTFGLSSLSALEGLVAPLVTVDLCFWWPWASKAADVLRLIAPFRNTLQKAVLYLSDVSGGEYPLEATTPSFPHVRSLSLRGLDRGISLPLMRHAFPNVQDLTMTDLRLTSTQLGHMRQQNVIVGRTPGWQSLRRLFGDFMPLYNLGLTLYRVWRVDVCRVHPHGDSMIALNHLIVTTQPSRLLIHFDHRCQSPDIDAFIHLFDPGNPCVTGFALDVPSHHVMRPDTGMVPQFLVRATPSMLRLLRNSLPLFLYLGPPQCDADAAPQPRYVRPPHPTRGARLPPRRRRGKPCEGRRAPRTGRA